MRLKDSKHLITVDSELCIKARIYNIKNKQTQRDNTCYIGFTCGDQTVSLSGAYWLKPEDNFQDGESFLAEIRGTIKMFYEDLTFNVKSITRITDEPISDYLEVSESYDEDNRRLDALMATMAKGQLGVYGKLTYSLLYDLEYAYREFPASQKGHHSFRGGLLNHSLETLDLALEEGKKHSVPYDQNLLICAALLHDIGKVHTLSTDNRTGQNSHTIYGTLLNHSICGVNLLQTLHINFPQHATEILNLQHCVASHHGDVTRGALTSPLLDEALIVNIADSISGRYNTYNKALERMNLRKSTTTLS